MKKERIDIKTAFANLDIPGLSDLVLGVDGRNLNQRREKIERERRRKASPPTSKNLRKSLRRQGLAV